MKDNFCGMNLLFINNLRRIFIEKIRECCRQFIEKYKRNEELEKKHTYTYDLQGTANSLETFYAQ